MFSCQRNADGKLALDKFPDKICWEGFHIMHALFAITIGTVYIVISTVVALIYFENRMTSDNQTARQNSRGDVAFILNKIILQTAYTFLGVLYSTKKG